MRTGDSRDSIQREGKRCGGRIGYRMPIAALIVALSVLIVVGCPAPSDPPDPGGGGNGGDTTPPSAPSVTRVSPTPDTTPTWDWNDVADAVAYRYGYSEGTWITEAATDCKCTPATPLSASTHTLYVQAKDAAGNWSASGSKAIQVLPAGYEETMSAGGVSFDMRAVPDKSFFTETDDSGTATVSDVYWIAETEVTYELWSAVHTWATSNGYTFAHTGKWGTDRSTIPTSTR